MSAIKIKSILNLFSKLNRYFACCFFTFLFTLHLHASSADSLRTAISNAKSDTARARVMILLGRELQPSSPEESIKWADSALSITRDKGPADLHARAASLLGILYNGKGIYQVALKYFIESLHAFEQTENILAQSNVQNSIGNTYLGNQDFDRAQEAFKESVKLATECGNLKMEAVANAGISSSLLEKKPNEAMGYIQKSRQLFHQLGETENEAFTQTLLALIYIELKQYDKAEAQLDSSLLVFQKSDDNYRLFSVEKALGDVYIKTNRLDKALEILFKSEILCKQMDAKDNLSRVYKSISDAYEAQGDFKQSLTYFKLYNQYNDSVFNTESNRQLLEAQEAFGSEKKQREIEIQKSELSNQAIRQNLLLAGMFLLLIIAFLVYRQYRAKRRSNQQLADAYKSLENKNDEIALKNKEITDSIHYAKRIQESFLPDEATLKSLAAESFLLYQPKDIVSGDFYWLNRVGDSSVFAVADCTGHGVPGAFLSAICNDLMNHVIRDIGIVAPDEILRQLDAKLQQLQGKGGVSHDGMDIAICVLNTHSGILQYAGARRPLLILRNQEVIEIHASKFSIGEQVADKKFEVHDFKLQSGDTFYLFTDGFADQFGGPRGKKFKYRRFQELLQSLSHQPMNQQQKIIEQTFAVWKNDLEQVDDVCILGIHIN
jgi:serine phosphatase RsbU (regulator of sigma subunit)